MRRSIAYLTIAVVSISLAGCDTTSDNESQAGSAHGKLCFEVAKLCATDAGAGDLFGFAVAIRGETLVVGADQDDQATGAAYVFARTGNAWRSPTKLVADDAAPGDRFGFSVATDGDTIVVGARGDEVCGSAYVFIRDGQNWRQQGKLMATDAADDDRFGRSVAVSGDFAVVGADRNDDAGLNTGSAYVFTRDGETWNQQEKLLASDAGEEDRFGRSVAISGNTVVIGGFCNNDHGKNSGSAYVFASDGTQWYEQAKLVASDPEAFDFFGSAVAIDGDTIVIAARGDDDGGDGAGSAYIFNRTGTRWSQQAKLIASDAAAEDRFGNFGESVAISGDVVIVGARNDDDAGRDAGSAYVFVRNTSNWREELKLIASDLTAGDVFGGAVGISGHTVVGGASKHDGLGDNCGSAYVFDVATPGSAVVVDHGGINSARANKLTSK